MFNVNFFVFVLKLGYQVVRALDHYHTNDIKMQLSESDPERLAKTEFVQTHQTNLKISVATNSNISWSKTFDLDSSAPEKRGMFYLHL